jgi:hypothetical protein
MTASASRLQSTVGSAGGTGASLMLSQSAASGMLQGMTLLQQISGPERANFQSFAAPVCILSDSKVSRRKASGQWELWQDERTR